MLTVARNDTIIVTVLFPVMWRATVQKLRHVLGEVDSFYHLSACTACRMWYFFTISFHLSACPMLVLYLKECIYRYTFLTFRLGHHSSSFVPHLCYKVSMGTYTVGAFNTRGGKDLQFFRWNWRLSRKWYEIGQRFLWITSRNFIDRWSIFISSDDLEWPWGPNFPSRSL